MPADERIKPYLLVIGVHSASPGYPNVLYRLNDLRESGRFAYREINVPFWQEGLAGSRALRLFRVGLRAILAHTELLYRYLKSPVPQLLYVPYPAVSVLALLSLLPRRFRPGHVVADVYISVYDTVVNDRCLLGKGNPLARLVWLIEKRAYSYADMVVVDTRENAAWLCAEFNLTADKVRAVPLSTDEQHFRSSPYQPKTGALRVLFVGTLVPLHGAIVIIKAFACLGHRPDINFRLIGDGQDAHLIEQAIQDPDARNVDWVRDWQPPERIAEEIERADICLGIFGDTAKAQRVCPFKVYAYAGVGRPIITSQTDWLTRATSGLGYTPFATVPVGDASALADKIVELADDPGLRRRLAEDGRRFYAAALTNSIANEQFLECLMPVKA